MQSPLIDVASCMGRAIFCGGGCECDWVVSGDTLMLGCRRVSCLVGIHGKKNNKKEWFDVRHAHKKLCVGGKMNCVCLRLCYPDDPEKEAKWMSSAESDACNGARWRSTSQSEERGEVSSGTGGPPPDRMIACSHHFSPSLCNYFQMHGRFQPPASWWQGTPQGITWHGTAQLSLLALTSSPPPVTLISHCQNPVWFVFESIYVPHREYLVSSFPYSAPKSSHPMNHSFFFSFFFFFFISLVSTC